MIDDSAAPKLAAIRKAGKYGDLDLPFLVAINAQEQHLDRIDMMEALFGKEGYLMSRESEDVRMVREPNGLWTSATGPRYSRVSAVLLVSSLVPWSVGSCSPWLFLNPWAKRPLPSVLTAVSTARPSHEDHKMIFSDGADGTALFGLPPNWFPHDD